MQRLSRNSGSIFFSIVAFLALGCFIALLTLQILEWRYFAGFQKLEIPLPEDTPMEPKSIWPAEPPM